MYMHILISNIQTSPPWSFPARYARKGEQVIALPASNLPEDSLIKYWVYPVNKAEWSIDASGPYGVGVLGTDLKICQ